MDNHRFDTIAKSVARQPSRRQLLRFLGGGSAVAAAAVLGSASRDPAAAQATPCTIAFTGTVRVGPTANSLIGNNQTPGELTGALSFTPDAQGAIAQGQGQLQIANGPAVPAVGQIDGRAINLRITLSDQYLVVAVGTAAQDLAQCQGAVDGLLTGPQHGDLGDWHGTLSPSGTSTSATAAAGASTGSGGSNPPPAGTTAPPTMTATAAPTMTATAPSAGATCTADMTTCNGVCTNVQTDPANCGGCGFACPSGIGCVGAICCNPGTAACTNDKYCCDGPCINGRCVPGGVHPTATAGQ